MAKSANAPEPRVAIDNPRRKFDPRASNKVESTTLPAITAVVAGAPGSFEPSHAVIPATLAALQAHPAVGTTGMTGKATWTTGQFVNLGDGSKAHWDGSAWVTGIKTLAEEAAAE